MQYRNQYKKWDLDPDLHQIILDPPHCINATCCFVSEILNLTKVLARSEADHSLDFLSDFQFLKVLEIGGNKIRQVMLTASLHTVVFIFIFPTWYSWSYYLYQVGNTSSRKNTEVRQIGPRLSPFKGWTWTL